MPKSGRRASLLCPLECMQAWLQRPNESPKSYRLFQEYLLQGEIRSLARVHAWSELQGYNLSISAIRKLAQRHDWRERARAYDAHIAQERFEQHAETEQECLRRIRTTARLLIDKALLAWKRLTPEQLTPREVLLALRLGAQLQASVAEQETRETAPLLFGDDSFSLLGDLVDLLVAEDEERRTAILDAVRKAIEPFAPVWMRSARELPAIPAPEQEWTE